MRIYFIKYIQLTWKKLSINDQIVTYSFLMLFRIKIPVRHMWHFPNNVFQFIFTEIPRRNEGWMTKIQHYRTPFTSSLRWHWKPELAKKSNTRIFQNDFKWWVDGFYRATNFHVDFQIQLSLEMTLTWPRVSCTYLLQMQLLQWTAGCSFFAF